MNSYKAIDVYHLRADRTIETILVSGSKNEKVLFVYNYEGLFYRVFDDLLALINFFRDAFEPKVFFEDEHQLENYLKRLQF